MTVDPAERTGWFWDLVEGRGDPPPAPALLGFELVDVDAERGVVDGTFVARPGTSSVACRAGSSPRCSTRWSAVRC